MTFLYSHVRLGEIGEILDRKRKPITKRDRVPGPYPYYGATGVLDYVDNYIFDEPLVLIGEDGAKWGAGENTAYAVDGKCWVNNHAHVIRPNRKLVIDSWLIYYLNSADLSEFITGLTVPKLNQAKLREIPIPLPPLPEQKRIVAILDEAFAGLETAAANTEKNLANARELFKRALELCFDQVNEKEPWSAINIEKEYKKEKNQALKKDRFKKSSSTRGRAETDRAIEGDFSLAVCMPKTPARKGWRWSKLSNIARLESGHTPTRKKPEYWGGNIPWIGIKDAKLNHGKVIKSTQQYTNELGIQNSAARVLPSGTVCLSRTASVGYVVITGTEMATSQDFVNWICSEKLDPHFLQYLFLAEGKGFQKYSSGAVHQTIYFPEVKAFHICHPGIIHQKKIVQYLDILHANCQNLESIYKQKLTALTELKQSLLQKAFSGELTAEKAENETQRAVA